MKSDFLQFYKTVLEKKAFYFPVLFFAIVGYSFSIYNRTLGWDDLMRDHYVGSGNVMLSGRWGMVLWTRILGLVEFDPFIDRFLSLLFFVIAAILLCYILYSIDKTKNALTYGILASLFITYPLINEIWEYGGANFEVTGGLCIVSLVAVIMRNNWPIGKKVIIAGILMILPMATYESVIFYYLVLVSIIIYYEYINGKQADFGFKYWINLNLLYFSPILIALIGRFSISYIINTVLDLNYTSGGATELNWLSTTGTFTKTILGFLASNVFSYVLSALVYFPILIFFITLITFVVYSCLSKRIVVLILGFIVIVSVFFQAIIQGAALPYRNAQTITLFVSFVAYLLMSTRYKYVLFHRLIYFLLVSLCWYQAVYMNRILGLNNLRSDNEVAIIHQIGLQLTSNFDKKPIVFVSPYRVGDWILRQVTVNDSTWNGRLFYRLCNKLALTIPYKYVDSNVNCATEEYPQIQEIFNYLGYDIDVIQPRSKPHTQEYCKDDLRKLNEAIAIVKEKKIRPYQIYDQGNYIIVILGGRFFKNGYF